MADSALALGWSELAQALVRGALAPGLEEAATNDVVSTSGRKEERNGTTNLPRRRSS